MNTHKHGTRRLFQALMEMVKNYKRGKIEEPTEGMMQMLHEEMVQNQELNINPLPLPGRKNGLSIEEAYPVSSVDEAHKLIGWLAKHADRNVLNKEVPAGHNIVQQNLLEKGPGSAFNRLTVAFFNNDGFLIRRGNYYFDISSFFFKEEY